MSDENRSWLGIMEPLGRLARVVDGREDVIATYCQAHAIEVAFVVVIGSSDDSLPYLDISADMISLMARLGACISFDPYLNYGPDYGENREPAS